MANRKVTFDIEANDKTDAGIKNAAGNVTELEKKTEQAGTAARNSGLKFTELNSALQIGSQVMKALGDIYQGTVVKFVEYADVVRTLRDITGESAEEMSRVVQLTDDYKISTEKLTMVQKTLAQQGKSLNIDTLSKMSDEYLKLSTGQERQLYLTKNLGREGADYAGILKQGSAAIREQAGAINEFLILGDEQLQQARDLEIAQDNLSDTWEAFIMRVAPKALNTVTSLLNATNDRIRAAEIEKELNNGVAGSSMGLQVQALAMAKAEREAAAAAKLLNEEHKPTPEIIRAVSAEATNLITIAGNLSASEDSYTANVKKNNDEFETLIKKRSELLMAGYTEQSKAVREVESALDANAQKAEENAAAHELATNRIILSFAQQILAADGLTKEEAEALLKMGEDMGVYAEGTSEKLQIVIDKAQEYVGIISGIPSEITTTVKTIYVTQGNITTGGSTVGIPNSNQATAQAAGGSGIVPSGFNHDNFLVGLSSGERFDVKPSSRVGASDKGGGGNGGNTYQFFATGITDPEKFLRFVGQKIKLQGGLPQ